jgi:predicted CopG family antitoxin
MLPDHVYDILNQLVQESQSFWHIKRNYIVDAQERGEQDLVAFWEKLAEDKEKHIEELEKLLSAHLSE